MLPTAIALHDRGPYLLRQFYLKSFVWRIVEMPLLIEIERIRIAGMADVYRWGRMPYIVDWHCLPGDASCGNNWQAPPKRKRSPSLSTGTQWSLRQHFDRGCICTLWARTRWHQAIQLWPTSHRKTQQPVPGP